MLRFCTKLFFLNNSKTSFLFFPNRDNQHFVLYIFENDEKMYNPKACTLVVDFSVLVICVCVCVCVYDSRNKACKKQVQRTNKNPPVKILTETYSSFVRLECTYTTSFVELIPQCNQTSEVKTFS